MDKKIGEILTLNPESVIKKRRKIEKEQAINQRKHFKTKKNFEKKIEEYISKANEKIKEFQENIKKIKWAKKQVKKIKWIEK